MSDDNDIAQELRQAVVEAAAQRRALQIVGGGSKSFYGRHPEGTPLATAAHAGIIAYEPTELVITARAGTPMTAIDAALAAHSQELPFEPPHFGGAATLGGTVACGFSGPRRPYAGAARDFVLGVRVINGSGERLTFGGQVMKNVAGYDISRLMTGALGTLGLLTEVSIKVAPRPRSVLTVALELDAAAAIENVNRWAGRPLPVSGAAHADGVLRLRLAGAPSGVAAARARIGGEEDAEGERFWHALREHTHPLLSDAGLLWRISVPAATPPLELSGDWLIDWGGAQRWLRTEADADTVRRCATACGGHATQFRGGDRGGEVFQPLPKPLMVLHRNVKRAFDPQGVLNPGRLYAGI